MNMHSLEINRDEILKIFFLKDNKKVYVLNNTNKNYKFDYLITCKKLYIPV